MNKDSMCTKPGPEAEETAKAVLEALLEIRIYQCSHTVDEARGRSIEALVAAGAFSSKTAAFIENHQTRFYGFPSRLSQDIAVLDVVLTDRTIPLRVVGFADGHVERITVDTQVTGAASEPA